jgi:hypothetical protein
MYDGYLEMGGNEVLNRQRAYVYTQDGACPVGWLQCGDCPGLDEALGDEPYTLGITEAPWYDAEDPATGRFFGAYPITMQGLSDSTRVATITEGILDGGTIQGGRRAVRQVRCTALLIAQGMDALESGMSWLDAVLDTEACSTHAGGCGEVDSCFFVACPPERPSGMSIEDYDQLVTDLRRQLHGVVTISGPIVTQELHRGEWYGYLVEFTIAAATPFVYGMPVDVTPVDWQASGVYQDSPFNLATHPSAELAEAAFLTVATNLSTNPSVETNATGWLGNAGAITGPVPTTVTTARTTAIAANGVASFQVRLNAAATPGVTNQTGYLQAYQDVSLVGLPANTRISITEWGAVIPVGLASTPQNLRMRVQFYNASNVLVGTETVVEGEALDGFAFQAKSLTIPATATYVRVIIISEIIWSTGADVSVYADALAVTVP